jgi:hypothetical protein
VLATENGTPATTEDASERGLDEAADAAKLNQGVQKFSTDSRA